MGFMTELEKMINGDQYVFDKEVYKLFIRSREICRKYNKSSFSPKKRKKILEQLFKRKITLGDIYIEPPFFSDFGMNTTIGSNFYANFGLTILDCGRVTIGDNVMIGPNVDIYAVTHPIDIASRALGRHISSTGEVRIGNNVWIGGKSTIMMGVTIGDNSIIGAGSVVTKDIPANVIAVGNPCKVLREIT